MYYIFLIILIPNITDESKKNADNILNKAIKTLFVQNKTSKIQFSYPIKNNFNAQETNLKGELYIYNKNTFKIEFTEKNLEVIYKDNTSYTILKDEKEIHIEENNQFLNNQIIFLLINHTKYFNCNIDKQTQHQTILNLRTKKYIETVYNTCIDKLSLPKCLKLPLQCRLGLSENNNMRLDSCLSMNQGYIKNNINNFKLTINNDTYSTSSITYVNLENKSNTVEIHNVDLLDYDLKGPNINTLEIKHFLNQKYRDFEIIDLR